MGEGAGGPRSGRGRGGGRREGGEPAAAGCGACGVSAEGEVGGEEREGGAGMRARGPSRRLPRPDGKSRAQPERSIKMAAASAVAAASGR